MYHKPLLCQLLVEKICKHFKPFFKVATHFFSLLFRITKDNIFTCSFTGHFIKELKKKTQKNHLNNLKTEFCFFFTVQ